MNYTTVDLNEWSRGKLFRFYMEKMRIVMSMTVDVDVTNLKLFELRSEIILENKKQPQGRLIPRGYYYVKNVCMP